MTEMQQAYASADIERLQTQIRDLKDQLIASLAECDELRRRLTQKTNGEPSEPSDL